MSDLPSALPVAATRAVVVGGCGGIGRAYVEGLRTAGCRVAALDRPRAFAAAPPPEDVRCFEADATMPDTLLAACATAAEAWDGVDLFAYLAGIMAPPVAIADTDLGAHDHVMEVNVRGALLCTQALLPALRRAHGAIVYVASGLATNPEPRYGSYSMSKAGLIALAKTVAREEAPAVRANVVAPGVVDTAFLSGGTGGDPAAGNWFAAMGAQRDRILASIPLGRMAVAADVVGPMLFLSAPAARYITGQVLHVNGGRLMP